MICYDMGRIMNKWLTKTIKVSDETKQTLDNMKIHPREPYEDVIKRLIHFAEIQPLTSDKKP